MPGDWRTVVEPRTRRFLDYWESKRRPGGGLPDRSSVDPRDIPDLLPDIFLADIEVASGAPRFRYRLVGASYAELYGCNLAGRYVDEVFDPPWVGAIIASYTRAFRSGSPDLLRAPVAKCDRSHIIVSSAVAPLSADGETVDMLLGFTVRATD